MKFVAEARQFWRWWSVRLAAVAGFIATYVTLNPKSITDLVAYVPEYWRPAASVLIGLIVAGIPTLARVIQQGSKDDA